MALSRLRLAGGVLLAVAAVVVFVLAFTRFDDGGAPQPGSIGSADYESRMMRDAQVSVVLGMAGCALLIGAFACWNGKAQDGAPGTPTAGPADPRRPAGPQP